MYYNYAIKTLQGGDANKAKAALTKAISLNSCNKEAYFFLGCLYFDEQDYTNALEYFKLGGVDGCEGSKSYLCSWQMLLSY